MSRFWSIFLLSGIAYCTGALEVPATGAEGDEIHRITLVPHALHLKVGQKFTRILALGETESGFLEEVTERVRWEYASEGGLTFEEGKGWIGSSKGEGTLRAWVGDVWSEIPWKVEASDETQERVSFVRDVLPVMAKLGCSAGSCHAKKQGQNGFKLSVFSYDPFSDYQQIVKESRGRRVSPASPSQSLLLKKPTLEIPHEGGQRFAVGSEPYRLLEKWIGEGMAYQVEGEPVLSQIELFPEEGRYRFGTHFELMVFARYSDGSIRDVSHLAAYESSDKELADVDHDGAVQVGKLRGEGVIVARFMGLVDETRLAIPADKVYPPEVYARLTSRNYIDELAYKQFEKLGLIPSARCDDATFLRRAWVTTLGRLPSAAEVESFLADPSESKREAVVDRLLEHPGFADFWANKWADLFRPNPDRVGVKSVFLLDQWLRESFRQNKPYDRFAREILTAEGSTHRYGPTVIYRDRREPEELTTLFSQIFLGVRMECARCHHHPFEKWAQEDFYRFAAYFGSLKRKGHGLSPPISAGTEHFYHGPGGQVKHPVTQAVMSPKPPDGPEPDLSGGDDPRKALAAWVTTPGNPFFAKALVNRVWAVFFGRGFIEPVDDFRVSNPPSNPALLEALAKDFEAGGYDLKHVMRRILNSELFQVDSLPNESNQGDSRYFSRYYRQRLSAETLLDAVGDITGIRDNLDGLPPESRAMETWNYKIDSELMDAFGRPNSSSDCPCERDTKASVVQALHLMNAKGVQRKLSDSKGHIHELAGSSLSNEELVRALYLRIQGRLPQKDELALTLNYFEQPEVTRQIAAEDLAWALLNSVEFIYNH